MGQVEMGTAARVLEVRLHNGAQLLFDMEQRGDTGREYDRYLELWEDLLLQYETLDVIPGQPIHGLRAA